MWTRRGMYSVVCAMMIACGFCIMTLVWFYLGIETGLICLIAVDRVTFPSFTVHAVSGCWILLTSDLFPSLSHVSCPFVWWNVIITPGCRDENFHNGEILFNRAEMLNCHLLICWNLWQGLMDGVDTLTLFFLQSYFPFLNILLIFVWKTI